MDYPTIWNRKKIIIVVNKKKKINLQLQLDKVYETHHYTDTDEYQEFPKHQ